MSAPQASIRVDPRNPNHHLWNNHGTWFIHYTIWPDALTAARVRHSLKTHDLGRARRRRDLILRSFRRTAGEGRP